jgi:hypothetical protein
VGIENSTNQPQENEVKPRKMMHPDSGDGDTSRKEAQKGNAKSSNNDDSVFSQCLASTGLCCFKAKEQAVIAKLEFQISQRQKQFGVDYLTLSENRASQQELNDCLKEAVKYTNELQREIVEHQNAVDIKEGEVTGVAPQNKTEEKGKKSSDPKESDFSIADE